jgi:RHH-type transcriptional regulator, proline utilization regulon repressor / proline dehydrogenase / delta 1-pyrroline-5-carboxylate dehydrogenase
MDTRKLPSFKNESTTDFSMKLHRKSLSEALESTVSFLQERSIHSAPIIDGEETHTKELVIRKNPSTGLTLGAVAFAGKGDVTAAITSLNEGLEAWMTTPVEVRSAMLHRIADIMTEKKLFLTSLIILEAGKPWKDADGDIAEAIDFCRYYADMATFLLNETVLESPFGEQNRLFYQAKGKAAVISPWNFPLAIACGMTVSALVAGNPVILKPAEQSSIIAYEFAKIVLEAGVPTNAFSFLPGRGEIVGQLLVESPDIDLICFTGSREVGLSIQRTAAEIRPGQRGIKRVISELGGKNAIVIDEDADLDEAIKGIIYSAFGYSGQKCSACSRLIIIKSIYEHVLERLVAATSDILIGDASAGPTLVGPVIDEEAHSRLLKTISDASRRLKLAYKGTVPSSGNFVPPTIFRDVPEDDFIWKNELFGPVLACAAANSFTDAIRMATSSEYALTGAVFSRNPENLTYAQSHFRVGNLYLNRGCTGSLVARQPFGGFKFSGVGSKAGGPDYLLQLVDPRVVTENTMRRGFTPELAG